MFGKREPVSLFLYGREGCHLCDVADAALRRTARRRPLTVTYVDVDTDDELRALYGERVPVVATADGTVVCEGKVSETRVRASLGKLAQAR